MAKANRRRSGRRARKSKIRANDWRLGNLGYEPLEDRRLLSLTPTTLSLAASSQSVAYGSAVTLTATVDTVPADSPVLSVGTVTFMDGSTVLGTMPVTSDTATLTNVQLTTLGLNSLSASYSGSAGNNIAGSTSTVSPSSIIITVAGGSSGPGDGGPATAANLDYPQAVAVDSAGDLFIADYDHDAVREVNHATGLISTVAGNGTYGFSGDGGQATAAELYEPSGIAVDSAGDLFIADTDNNRIREVKPGGLISTVAGNGSYGFSGDGGQATAAELADPTGVAVDSAGDLFIADKYNQRIREVTPGGTISTFAGNGSDDGYNGDGIQATAADLGDPTGVAVDSAGDLFIADYDNQRIREVKPGGVISTVAGNGIFGFSGDGGQATAAGLAYPSGVAVDSAGDLFIADSDNNRIREVKPGGTISTFAGTGGYGYNGDGIQATAATLYYPIGVAVDSAGDVFIADTSNQRIREVKPGGTISTVAGNGDINFAGDGGAATAADLYTPGAVAIDSAGDLFIADSGNNVVREVNHATGVISTVAGNGTAGFSGDGSQATAAELNYPAGVAVDSAGDLFIADYDNQRIREVTPGGVISTVAGNGTHGFSGDGGQATAAELYTPTGVAVDSAGDLFIADFGNSRIREVKPGGTISTFAGNGTAGFGGDGSQAASAELNYPFGVAVDSAGDLFIADEGNNRIREVKPGGVISTVAGNGAYGFSGDGSQAASAELANPTGVAVDSAGDLFIADIGNQRIREVTPGGVISTVAGNGTAGFSGDGIQATAATLNYPFGVAVDSAGDLFIADEGNNRIRELAATGISINVNQATPTVSVTDGGGTYSGAAYAVTSVSATGAGGLNDTNPSDFTFSYSGSGPTSYGPSSTAPSAAGSYAVVASFAASTDYTSATGSTTFTIGQAMPTVSVTDGGGTYSGAAYPIASVSATGAGGLNDMNPSDFTFSYSGRGPTSYGPSSTAPSAAGTYTVAASFAASTDYTSATGSTTFTINQAMPTVSVTDGGGMYSGSAYPIASVSAIGAGSLNDMNPSDFTFSYSGSGPTNYGPSSTAPSAAGSYAVVASFAASTDYTSASGSTTFTIGQAMPTVSVTDGGGMYSGAAYPIASVSAIGAGSLNDTNPSDFTFSYSGRGPTSYGPSSTAPSAAGTYTVAASFAASTDYTSASGSTTFTIGQAMPTVSVTDGGGTYSGAAYPITSVSATGAGSLNDMNPSDFTFSYSGSGPTSYGPSSTAPSAAGSYTVLASFAASTDYTSAAGSTTFTINQAVPTVSVTDGGGMYSGSAYPIASVSAIGAGSLNDMNPSDFTFSYSGSGPTSYGPSSTAPSAAGSYAVLASFAASTDYTSASGSTTFTIGQAMPTVSVTDGGGMYSGSAYPIASVSAIGAGSLNDMNPSDFTFSYSGSGPTIYGPSSTAPSAAGSYTVLASFAASTDYTSATGSTTFTIGQAMPTVSVTDNGGTYNGAAFTATDTVAGVGSQSTPAVSLENVAPTLSYYSGTSASGTGSTVAPSAAGTYTVLASFAGSTDYTSGAASVTFSISRAAPTLIASDAGGIYTSYPSFPAMDLVNGAASLEGVAPTIVLYYPGASATGTGTSVAPSTAGTYTVLASFAGSTDWTSASASTTFTIAPAAPTLTVTDAGGVYSGSTFPATYMIAGVGTQATPGPNLEYIAPTLSYYSGTATGGSPLPGAPAAIGTYTVVASFAGSADYLSRNASVQFTIAASLTAPTLSVVDTSGVYNSAAFVASATVAGTNHVFASSLEGVSPTLAYYSGTGASGMPLGGAPSSAGTYTALASFAGSTDYASGAASTTFTIAKATPKLSVSGGAYDGAAVPASIDVAGVGSQSTPAGSLEGISPTAAYYHGATLLSGPPTTVGTYAVVANFAGSADYLSVKTTTTYSITKATPSVSVSDTSGAFDTSAFTAAAPLTPPGGQSAAGSLEGVKATLIYYPGTIVGGSNGTTAAPKTIGTYTVVADFQGSTDYASASATTTFTISKAIPTLTVSDPGGTYTSTTFPASDTVAGVGSESAPGRNLEYIAPTLSYYAGTSASGTPSSSAPSNAGTYTVVANFAGSPDYAAASASATFTIAKATPAVTVADLGGTANGTKAFAATATVAGVGTQVAARSSLENVAPTLLYYPGTSASGTPSNSAPISAGTYTVLATFPGSTDYALASASATFTVIADPFITAIAGSGQTAAADTPFAQALTVNVVDTADKPVSGAAVTFTAPASGAGGTFAGGQTSVVVMTNAAGTATAPAFTANSVAGSYSVIASTPGAAVSATFTLTNQPGGVVSNNVPATIGPAAVAIAIGGSTGSNVNDLALQAILDEWSSPDTLNGP